MPTRTFLLLMLILLSVVAPTWAQDESPAKSGGSQKAERKIPANKVFVPQPGSSATRGGGRNGARQVPSDWLDKINRVFANESASSSDWQMVVSELKKRYPTNTSFKSGEHRPVIVGNHSFWLLDVGNAGTNARVVLQHPALMRRPRLTGPNQTGPNQFTADPATQPAAVALRRVPDTSYFVGNLVLPEVWEGRYQYEVDGQVLAKPQVMQVENYERSADEMPKQGYPVGKLITMPDLTTSKFYPGTTHKWWVYVPAQYSADKPAAVMIFQDGESYVRASGAEYGIGSVPVVFDNLIHEKRMPVTIGIFISPGVYADRPKGRDGRQPSSRSDEYDTCTDKYACFLETEILPTVAKEYSLRSDPAGRAICGASSGGSCAFTAAWHRPDLFGRVLSQIGSFCDFRWVGAIEAPPTYRQGDGTSQTTPAKGQPNEYMPFKRAHDYPGLIRKTKPIKPIRVFLQDGEQDLDNDLGNWPLANMQMAKALEYSGYKYKLVFGEGFHSRRHGEAIMPQALEWLWKDD